ncbi:MAG TPA: hypothetical protein PLU53_09295, partial [Bacteroidia bacterium]|nr:hypothetical protein [Bacteroidia bacterium]
FKAKNIFEYKDDLKISDTEYGPNGEFRYTWKYQYDPAGRMTVAEQVYPEQLVNAKRMYTYNPSGQLTEEKHENRSVFQRHSRYTYDENGLMNTSQDLSATGRVLSRSRFVYEHAQ